MSTSVFNRRWAALLLEALTRHGVRHICIAPGSRSTPLTLSAAEHGALICHTHFDERGLGHLALGLAKTRGEPVAIVVTSGTAAANLYPAIIEAGLTGERLIVLTADRPPELIDCGANQAIRQHGLYASHPTQALNLPRPTPDIPARWLVSTLDSALSELAHGALHINCPFAEPLYGADDEDAYLDWLAPLGDWLQGREPWLQQVRRQALTVQADWGEWRQRRGVVIAGNVGPRQGAQIAQWAAALGWPLIGDVLSQSGQPLPCADIWLACPAAVERLRQAEIVVQFGGNLTGKRLLQWQAQCQPREFWLVDERPGRLDPAHHRGRRLIADVGDWLSAHPPVRQIPWADDLTTIAHHARRQAMAYLAPRFGEAQLAQRVPELLPPEGQLFVGNSLAIRLIDALAQLPAQYPVYANRGASGIDGLISTLAGVQRGNSRATLGIVGDLSALYDLNALALLRQAPAPLVLIVVNNNGGQIFSLLPTPEAQRETFYCMPQNVEFAHAAAMFGLNYVRAERWQQVADAVANAWRQGGVTLLEVIVPPQDGAQTLNALVSLAETW
ncbi:MULTISPECIES: 2-succinyl-5-enolpyruvyl-6-hydroxy-3-cyclohexene-1-carboxylic-acid synthase [unclassified Brenneria]|uniref:2-succinyl-5-enolpyruvyl-6-hydroxy-3- cyclohexene-1-carboxylic-acid synthase n=1 Tax=unclassified Brenneria TaxID=2634434 RepID=UPI0029C5EEAE|nr:MULTISPECIES: 2-succinyl-5-enolpyruvyl-6-hydroxy-3-cyclohexene-1-carboxylic-acid synthase [unclassified Brenneria]MDX5628164.1 2-succinyl-5-enolpyruvyl-6-hydroxy-3-cyclohexene-1-carboxylic-acid synthase [Brenneria sp. L3-3Z]MDX5694816.1 2-succinyl-5-enolpyruvyl-6-hydroxy-3-cyclohexene-1-carboxylic-acid synthase [Brenneria sp. L4-2C]